MMREIPRALVLCLVCMVLSAMFPAIAPTNVAAGEKLTVGVLKFGTVNWQLRTVKDQGFDQAVGIDLEILPLASKNATSVALQAGSADMIVTDWIWALRQRAEGEDFVFVPYTRALGALVTAKGVTINDLGGLKGKRLGIAGGPLDKSWLILRASALRHQSLNLAESVEMVFGAPPLLSEQLRTGGVDAVLTFWPYAARLKAEGFHTAVRVEDVLAGLGIKRPPPLVGYVFRQAFAERSADTVMGFLAAIARANAYLAEDDEAWEKIRPLMKAANDEEFEALKAGYRTGIPHANGAGDIGGAEKLFQIMKELGGEKLLGRAESFDRKLFWQPDGAPAQ